MLVIWLCGMEVGIIKDGKYLFEREEWYKVFQVVGMVKFGIICGGICFREEKKYFLLEKERK